ncbi:hypothetical protein TGMAS_220070 [Toxoplasma gondii MAS]|uniref:Uncharacterized protein n=1 Tax=Toxoplasma gondii MAS TaxID=943118 RepID=A0A086PY21_TOXGO|nr:hypothetical protein TGMAS_220070 [Toxoplasma gondii MAS]
MYLSESLSQDGAASFFRRVIPSANVHTHIRGYKRGVKFQETTGCTERHLFFISEEYGSFSGKIVAVERDTHSVYVEPDLASPGLPTHESGFGFSFLPDDFAEESALVYIGNSVVVLSLLMPSFSSGSTSPSHLHPPGVKRLRLNLLGLAMSALAL